MKLRGDRVVTLWLCGRQQCLSVVDTLMSSHLSLCCRIPLSLTWNGKVESGMAHWFQFESDTERNSNVFQVANKIVSDKFPGEFGSERLVQQVVDQILHATASKHMEQVSHAPSQDHTPSQDHNSSQDYHTPPG